MSQATSKCGISPYLAVKGAREAIDFYTNAFQADEVYRLVDPIDGRIGHAEIDIAGATIMLADEYPDFGAVAPETLGGSPVKLQIYVDDVDRIFAAALALGATELRPVKDEFFGERVGTLVDPFGHTWLIASPLEDITPQEMQKRWNAAVTV